MNTHQITQRFFQFPGDKSLNPYPRQTPNVLYSWVVPHNFTSPKLVLFNQKLANEIGLGSFSENEIPFLVGNDLPDTIQPYSTAYAGHQFGNWAGQLGDGRAIYAGEISNESGKIYELQWKGTGLTPYSRHADGKAVFRSSLREYLMSEAMHHLGVPTSRAISLCFTGEKVVRDMLYNGNPQEENGAVVLRTSESFLRFGHFEFASLQSDENLLKNLADFTIENYYPEIEQNLPNKYALWFEKIAERTLDLVINWLRVGFVHGVMNTDNMSILGETIDYGPFAMLEEYDLNFTSNTTDLPGRRYAFGKQGQMAQWNLWQLANALFPLINDAEFLQNILEKFGKNFWKKHDEMLAKKFGFDGVKVSDEEFFIRWQHLMLSEEMDYTLFFVELEKARETGIQNLATTSYLSEEKIDREKINQFFDEYLARLEQNTITKEESLKLMKTHNPKFILRNYLLYDCIQRVENGDSEMLCQLIKAIENPYETRYEHFQQKRPTHYNDVLGCSMLSCSS
ncbi:YdiU family protein [Capnocytophaga sp. ARDL2]|uniref:protein adenylyltransferase SelO n=1 Tax=Capnocytophaga sp. ARDL2 TaxID=3238809 RepID=UPI003556E7F1